MGSGAVVALAIILYHQLPVSVLDDLRFVSNLRMGDVILSEARRHGLIKVQNVFWRLVAQTNEDMGTDDSSMNRDQAFAFMIKALAHVCRMFQASIKIVAPLMV